jgi:hypothetical protein
MLHAGLDLTRKKPTRLGSPPGQRKVRKQPKYPDGGERG